MIEVAACPDIDRATTPRTKAKLNAPRAIIAEDEPLLRDEIADALGTLWPELQITARAGDGIAALRELERQLPEILFLDIQMPGMTGLEVARQVSGRCHIVFVTAYDQHAVEAFEQGAADYVLKPVSLARLATTVTRLKERIRQPAASIDGVLDQLAAPPKGYLRWINASQGTMVKIITVDDVQYFQADSKYTLVVTGDGESLIRKPIKELVEELEPSSFWQIHRSTIVNVNAIAGIVRDMRGHAQVRLKKGATLLPVSDAFAHRFRQM
ncbi:MAG: DNA-binding response regulator [Rhodocyclaceae bacterium]|nr:MAG: DNA-binding response regulator [Rhodocyclaceae bacterium]